MKKLKLILQGLLIGMVINAGGCIAMEPIEQSVEGIESTDESDENIIQVKETEVKEDKQSKEVQFSDIYLVGFDFGGSSWGEYYDCISVNVIICTNREVLVTAPAFETNEFEANSVQTIAKLTLSKEQYANITKILDREELYNMKIESDKDVCDGSSYSLTLYDQDENVAKVCGAYEPTTEEFLEIYKGIMDNIPREELLTIRDDYVDKRKRYDDSDIVMEDSATNCYQAYYDFLTMASDGKIISAQSKNDVVKVSGRMKHFSDLNEWKSFGILDVDGDKVDELIISNRELLQSENDDTVYMIVSWTGDKIYAVERLPKQLPKVDFTSINYQDKDVMSVILQAESDTCIEGVTKEEKTFYYLVTTIAWLNDNYAGNEKEEIEARKDCEIVSNLGERTDFCRTNEEGKNIAYQYRMKEADVRRFYEFVMDECKDFKAGFDSSSVNGVYCSEDGYLYSHNETIPSDYVSLGGVVKDGEEVVLYGTAWDEATRTELASVIVSLIEDDNMYGYKVTNVNIK